MSRFQRLTKYVAIAGGAALLLAGTAYLAGAKVNTTKSIPVGLYWKSNASVEKGAYVMFCPPQVGVFSDAKERGYIAGGFCPGDYGYMMKRVLAAKGDEVAITDAGVRVNGELLPHSALIKADPSGRPLPRYQSDSYTLGTAEVLLMSDVSDTSFDGRYFGPVNRSQIITVIRPVLTW
ncbi:conjugative transfer signal peptidase TraF [Escherichia coli]|nr:conjugative transfer signal peptidase TraF [Escherichia coli]